MLGTEDGSTSSRPQRGLYCGGSTSAIVGKGASGTGKGTPGSAESRTSWYDGRRAKDLSKAGDTFTDDPEDVEATDTGNTTP